MPARGSASEGRASAPARLSVFRKKHKGFTPDRRLRLIMRQIPSLFLGALFACVLPLLPAQEDTIVLKNGDRVSGRVVRHEDGVLVVATELLGEIRVPAEGASIVTTSREYTAVVATPSAEMDSPTREPVVAVTDARDESRSARETSEDAWKRQVELGLSAQDGARDQTNLSLRLEAGRKLEAGSVNLQVSHQYGESDGNLVTDTTNARVTLTRDLNESVFVRGATRYDRNPLAGLERDAEQTLGLGYTLVDRASLNLSLGGGAALRNRARRSEATEWDGLLDAFGRLKCSFTERISLSQDFSLTTAPDLRDDFKVKFETALVNQLTDVLRMTLRYEYEYNSAAEAGLAERQRVVTGIGCMF